MKRFLSSYKGTSNYAIAGVEGAVDAIWEAACKSLDESSNEIFTISKETYCPVDKGDLKASAKDELVTDTGSEHTREISYDTDYAKIVHEVPYNHYNPPMAQWKYLETPMRIKESDLVEKIKSAVRDSIDS